MILVTGAAGFIGSHLVEALLRKGHHVVGVDNFDPYYSPDVKRSNLVKAQRDARFTLCEVDVTHEASTRSLFERTRPQAVVHLAAKAGVRPSILDPDGYMRVNALGTQIIADCARSQRAKLVFASSSSVYGRRTAAFREDDPLQEPASPYANSKREAENILEQMPNLDVVVLRLFSVYGPRQRPEMAVHAFCRKIAKGQPIEVFGDGQTARDYTFVSDAVSGIVAALSSSSPYRLFNIGTGRAVPLETLVFAVQRAMGRSVEICGLPEQPGDVPHTLADLSRARAALGYEPRVVLRDGLDQFVEWFRAGDRR